MLPVEEAGSGGPSTPVPQSPDSDTPESGTTSPAVATPVDDNPALAVQSPSVTDDSGITVLPVGSDILDPAEKSPVHEADIDTSHIKVQGVVFDMPEDDDPDDEIESPDVDHLTLAELGAQLGMGASVEVVVAEIDVDFDLAELGALMVEHDATEEVTPPAVEVNFDVAEPGATLGTRRDVAPPTPPDTSHITLQPGEASDTESEENPNP